MAVRASWSDLMAATTGSSVSGAVRSAVAAAFTSSAAARTLPRASVRKTSSLLASLQHAQQMNRNEQRRMYSEGEGLGTAFALPSS